VPTRLKLEGCNDCGSIKYRVARELVKRLEDERRLDRDSIVVESTSGNLGVALAAICARRGYRFVAVVDPKVPATSLELMRCRGAQIELVREADGAGGYLSSRLRRVQELVASSSSVVWTNQYGNPANPDAHYRYTGPEIARQTGWDLDCVFVAVSTGGTLAGVGRYLREVRPSVQIVAVDAVGSAVFGHPAAPRLLNGIGSTRRSEFLDSDLYDDHVLVGDEEAFACCRVLHAVTGLKVGGSSGAVIAACARYLGAHPELARPICICPDDGGLYADTVYEDSWLRAHGLTHREVWSRARDVIPDPGEHGRAGGVA
jgi:2,3-diaminopropionate biosynthesis protein SbnA